MTTRSPLLDRSEYVEQAYLFGLLSERIAQRVPMQELLEQLRHELLATTRLPMAIDFMLTELRHSGLMGPAMRRLQHYFNPFQTYLVEESEKETGRFGITSALQILHGDAKFRADYVPPDANGRRTTNDSLSRSDSQPKTERDEPAPKPQAAFFFQFEVLCRNRLNYDRGLTAMSLDPLYEIDHAKWILNLRAQIGLVDLADLLFLASMDYFEQMLEKKIPVEGKGPFLFGRKEGRIAFANRRKEPLYLFGAMQRHLGYPEVPRLKPADKTMELIPQMARRIERLESRIKLMEEERRASLDITQFYKRENGGVPPP
ncbi:MAG: hypothetical protein AAF989_03845 [Planctomycetota bacterium]